MSTPTPITDPVTVEDVIDPLESDLSPGDDGYPWQLGFDRHIIVEPGKITLPDGTAVTTAANGGPIRYELAEAIRLAWTHRCLSIKCRGNISGAVIGVLDKNKADHVVWPVPISGLVIRSDDPRNPATIEQIDFGGDIRATGSNGVRQILIKGVKLKNTFWPSTGASSKSPVLVRMGSWLGLIGIHDCEFIAADPKAFQGWGMMWGVRGHGRARWDLRRNKIVKVQEHFFYLDSPGADGGGPSYICANVQTGPSGRTGLQIVNRATPGAPDYGGPTGLGSVFIQRNTFWCAGGGGGSNITIAGHLGDVYIEDNDLTCAGPHGGIVIWADGGKGLHKTPEGFIVPFARLINNKISALNVDRSAIAVSGVGELIIDDFDIETNRTAIDLFNSNGGGIPNGIVTITAGIDRKTQNVVTPLPQYPGFAKAGVKMKLRGRTLTSAEILQYQAWA